MVNPVPWFSFDWHAWIGTEHCLRQGAGEAKQCCNDHTGCIWNDGHNGCMSDAKMVKEYDSPLLRKN
jgi:hypothetical protein